MDQRVLRGGLEEQREVPGIEHDRVDRDRRERPGDCAEHAPQPPPPRQAHESRAGKVEEQHGGAQADEDERGAQLRQQQVLRHVGAQQVLGELVHRGEQRGCPEGDPGEEGRLLERRDHEPALPGDAHGAHVQRDREGQQGKDAGIEPAGHELDSGIRPRGRPTTRPGRRR